MKAVALTSLLVLFSCNGYEKETGAICPAIKEFDSVTLRVQLKSSLGDHIVKINGEEIPGDCGEQDYCFLDEKLEGHLLTLNFTSMRPEPTEISFELIENGAERMKIDNLELVYPADGGVVDNSACLDNSGKEAFAEIVEP